MIAQPIPEKFDLPSARGRDYFTSYEMHLLTEHDQRYCQRLAERGWCNAFRITPGGHWRFPKKNVIEVLTYGVPG